MHRLATRKAPSRTAVRPQQRAAAQRPSVKPVLAKPAYSVASFTSATAATAVPQIFGKQQVRSFASRPEDTTRLIDASSRGNTKEVQALIDLGIDVNLGDYDKRTPVHLAASEGHVEILKLLVGKGANVNAVDRFGNTPLQDAVRGGKKEAAKYLESVGAIQTHDINQLRSTPEFHTAIQQSLPLLCERGHWDYAEAWVPADASNTKITTNDWYAVKRVSSPFSALRKGMDGVAAGPNDLITKAANSGKAIAFSKISKAELGDRFDLATKLNIRSGLVLPVLRNERILAVYLFLADETHALPEPEIAEFSSSAIGLLSSGLFKADEPLFGAIPGVPSGQQAAVFRHIVEEGVFNSQVVYQEVDLYYKLGLQQYYWEHFTANDISSHIHSFIAAKKMAQTAGRPDDIDYHVEAKDGSSAFYLSSSDHSNMVSMEDMATKLIESLPSSRAFSYISFISDNPIVRGATKKLHIAVVDTPKWASGETNPMEKDIWKIATGDFLRKPAPMRERYQELINLAVGKLSPTFIVHPTYRDGTIPVMMCFKRADGTSYLSQITELLKYNNMQAKRKFIETFSNGLVAYSLYLAPTSRESIDQFLNQVSLTASVPPSPLTPLFLGGKFSAEEYAFASSSTFFVYYFTNQKVEEFDILAKSFKDDPLNLGRLKGLQSKMKREAVSKKRIQEAIVNNAAVLRDVYNYFQAKCHGKPFDVAGLRSKIQKGVTNETDGLILNSMVTFTDYLLKTNFYSAKKCTLSYRFDPKFIEGMVPVVPFGIFLVTGYEFHGFHLRFDDIARGGVRMIRSASDVVYSQNFETLFQENYNLAHTQNKKNKDIPEAGSKGTVLLNRSNQANPELAFQKYVSGLMDLLVLKKGVFDAYKTEEVLFLGPDEGTADYMAWAVDYSRRRNYKYAKAITTGKPRSLGGIPHDFYSMTTRSVHAFVLGCLRKAGLKEENVTKVQTGGPDGDLGSNEILLSKDKTIAVIDGSGVAFDPNGLNRSELIRLAKARCTIKEFDRSKLTKDGFVVQISDRDVKLPTGETVESGLQFRNVFHLHPLCKADLFVPCGGRPEAVNLSNVNQLFLENGKPKFKFVVEGANLFLTQDARLILEKAGVVLYKDASANKGGVTSSSMEVLAALAMSDDEFKQHMMVVDKEPPAFYAKYVEEIQQRIVENADMEFECIWKEHELTGKARCLLTDEVSDKINTLNHAIRQSSLWNNTKLRRKVLSDAIPKELQKMIGIDTIIQRIPEAYAKAIFGAYLASHFVYKNGLSASEFAFFEFMTGVTTAAEQK